MSTLYDPKANKIATSKERESDRKEQYDKLAKRFSLDEGTLYSFEELFNMVLDKIEKK